MGEARFLIVEDDAAVRRAIARIVHGYGRPIGAATARKGSALVTDGSKWQGLFIDIGLPDGSGLDVLAWARASHNRAPAMVLTGGTEPEVINAAFDLQAHYVVKPFDPGRIRRFLADATSIAPRLEPALAGWIADFGLSEAEADVLRRAALGAGTSAIASGRKTSELTVRKHIVNLLRRTGDRSFHAAVERLLRELALP
jgi:DNA-binding NarL/FixJ family response regulator